MAREIPLWMQANMYAARLDRSFVEMVMRSQNRVFYGWQVTQHAGAADFTVDVTAGAGVILCTSQAFGGMWFCRSTAAEVSVSMPATPGAARTDLVYAVVRDPDAAGEAGNDWVFESVAGTVLPDNAIEVARVLRSPGEGAITNNMITDTAPRGMWPWTVASTPPSGRGVPGDLWVVCTS